MIGIFVSPFKAYAILVVDSDRILPFAVAAQFFQTVARRGLKIGQGVGCMQHHKFSISDALHFSGQSRGPLAVENLVSLFIPKRDYHAVIIYRFAINDKFCTTIRIPFGKSGSPVFTGKTFETQRNTRVPAAQCRQSQRRKNASDSAPFLPLRAFVLLRQAQHKTLCLGSFPLIAEEPKIDNIGDNTETPSRRFGSNDPGA